MSDIEILPAVIGNRLPEKADPAPGVYDDIPAEQYHAWKYASNSRLKDILEKSPMHCRYNMLVPWEQTAAMLLGSVIHCAILEPHLLEYKFIVDSPLNKNSHAYKAAHRALLEDNPGATIVSEKVLEAGRNIKEAFFRFLDRNPNLRALFDAVEQRERSLVWDWDGVRCKARVDADCPTFTAFLDIKKTQEAGAEEFKKTITTYRYYCQAAFYLEAAAKLGLDRDKFIFIAIEEKPPHGIAFYSIRDRAMQAGRNEIHDALAQWKRCQETGHWPGYPAEVQDIFITDWRFRELEERYVMTKDFEL